MFQSQAVCLSDLTKCKTNANRYTKTSHIDYFFVIASYNLAHWFFAYNYWSLSWRVFLIGKRKPKELYDRNLVLLNAAVCVFTLGMPLVALIVWLINGDERTYYILQTMSNFTLLLYCCFLFDGLARLVRLVQGE